MVMKASVTINLRLPLDLFEWLEAEGVAIALTPTATARALLSKARNEGITLK